MSILYILVPLGFKHKLNQLLPLSLLLIAIDLTFHNSCADNYVLHTIYFLWNLFFGPKYILSVGSETAVGFYEC